MTSNNLPPKGWDFESESPGEFERLNQIERQLKTSRPIPVHLNAAAWERILSASEVPDIPHATTVSLTADMKRGRRRWLSRAAGTIAAVWLCGVVVGSGAMFVAMYREPGIAQAENHQTPVVIAPQTPEQPDLAQPNLERSAASPNIAAQSPLRPTDDITGTVTIRSAAWLDTPGFGPEKPLRPFGNGWFQAAASSTHSSRLPISHTKPQEPLRQSESQRQLASSFVPPPAVTPQRILEDLMSDRITYGQPL